MSDLIAHRGPDDDGIWTHERGHVGFGHRRLSDHRPSPAGHQPMRDAAGRWITYNGEVYNYPELRARARRRGFRTGCDTEVVLRAHDRWGVDSLDRLRGMFAYALWDEAEQELLCARDRFGIKPFYYAQVGDVLYFASRGEGAAAVPAARSRPTSRGSRTTSPSSSAWPARRCSRACASCCPATGCACAAGRVEPERYWEVYYDLDFDHTAKYFEERIEALLAESVRLHLRSDVPVAAYLSGGLDSSVVASLASPARPGA